MKKLKVYDSQETLFAVAYNTEFKCGIILKIIGGVPERKKPEVSSNTMLDSPSELHNIPW